MTDEKVCADSCESTEEKCYMFRNIDTKNVTKKFFDLFNFDRNYQKKQKASIINTGDEVEIEFADDNSRPKISGGGLESDYLLKKIRLRWPSEHSINCKSYEMEAQFIHYSTKCDTYEAALSLEGGIAVMAIFYQISEESNYIFDDIIKSVPAIASTRNQRADLENAISPYEFFPQDVLNFNRYNGSFVVEPHKEAIWTVFFTPSNITKVQFDNLTQVFNEQNERIKGNNRGVPEDFREQEIFANCFCGKKVEKNET